MLQQGWSLCGGAKTPWITNNKHNILRNHTSGGTNGLGMCTPWTGGGACSTASRHSEDTTGGSAGGFSSSPMPQRNKTVVLTGTTNTPAYADNNTSQNSSQQQQTQGDTNMNLNTKAKITVATLNMNEQQEAGMGPLSKWADITKMVIENRIGILAVQEMHLDNEDKDMLNQWYKDKVRVINSADPNWPHASARVAFVLNKRLTPWFTDSVTYQEIIPGRALLLTANWHTNKVTSIMNVYAPFTENYLTYFGSEHQSKHLAKHLRYFARYLSSKYLR
jgi:hypothetical protein